VAQKKFPETVMALFHTICVRGVEVPQSNLRSTIEEPPSLAIQPHIVAELVVMLVTELIVRTSGSVAA
jgi:hypothetical protein